MVLKMTKISVLWVAGIALLFGASALAQDQPTKWEIGVDYSGAQYYPALGGSKNFSLNGGGGSIVYYLHHRLGFKMDLQGYTSSTNTTVVLPVATPLLAGGGGAIVTTQGNLFTYMFGPVFKHRGKIEPFGEVLVGGAYTNFYGNLATKAGIVGVSPNSNSFALTSGLGLDIHINRAISFRPVEIGYLLTRFSNPFSGGAVNQNNFRYVAGLTFNFGGE
jgi:hypothetical protein